MLDAGPTNPHTSLHLSGGLRVQRQVAGTNGEAPTSVGVSFLRCCPNSELFVLRDGLLPKPWRFSSIAAAYGCATLDRLRPQCTLGVSDKTPLRRADPLVRAATQ